VLHSNPTKAVHEARARNVDGEGVPVKFGTGAGYKTSSPVGELAPNFRGELAADLVNAQAWAGRATVATAPGDSGWQALTGPVAATLAAAVSVPSFIDDGSRSAGWPIGWGSHCLAHFGPSSGWDAITLGREDDGSGGGADLQFVAVQFTAGAAPGCNLFVTVPQGFSGWQAGDAIRLESRCSQFASNVTLSLVVRHPATSASFISGANKIYTGTTTDYTASPIALPAVDFGSTFQAGDLLNIRIEAISSTGQNTIRLGRLFIRWA
jgi:hypothetical protein